MTVDYMVFGAGLTGDVRRYEAGAKELITASKPEPHIASPGIYSKKSILIKFEVGRVTIEGKEYGFAFIDERPSNEVLLKAISKYNPKPIN
ncbi:hypothetical protein ACU61C_18295 [Klebsiella aerogenes]